MTRGDIKTHSRKRIASDIGKRKGVARDIAEHIEDAVRRSQGEVVRVLDRRVVSAVASAGANVGSLPVVPVAFVGPYTDDFFTMDGLGNVITDETSNGAASVSGGYLTLSADRDSMVYAWAFIGRKGGLFLPATGAWTIDLYVTAVSLVNGCKAALTATSGRYVWATPDYENHNVWVGYKYVDGTGNKFFYNLGEGDADVTVDTSVEPSRATPVCVRIVHSADATNHTFKFYYRVGASGSWTQIGSDVTKARSSWTDWEGQLDIGPLLGLAVGSGSASLEGDKIIVDYNAAETPDEYAFIPTNSFGGYLKDHVYIREESGGYLGVEPQPWMVVLAYGQFWRYDADEGWIPLAISHNMLTDVGEDDHHARKHGISDTAEHSGVAGGTENNFVSLDANMLPKDSGKSSASFADASHTHTDKADKVGSSDIEITDSAKGLILKSANGHRWRVTVNDSGTLVVTDIGT